MGFKFSTGGRRAAGSKLRPIEETNRGGIEGLERAGGARRTGGAASGTSPGPQGGGKFESGQHCRGLPGAAERRDRNLSRGNRHHSSHSPEGVFFVRRGDHARTRSQ